MYKRNLILLFSVIFTITSCGGGGGGTPYSPSPSQPSLSESTTISNLNPNNECKKAWYTSAFPTPTSTNAVFNDYIFFWQSLSLESMPICLNYYEATTEIESPWKIYLSEITEYSKYTLGQIVPINAFILGANPQSNTIASEKESYLMDFATVQAPVGENYNYTLANAQRGTFPLTSAGGGYSDEAAPNGADMQIPQDLIWGKAGFANENEKIQESLKIIAHEYFHTYQNSIKFYNEASKKISLPKSWSNRNLLDNEIASVPAYFPWWIEEGGAEFGGIVLSAKYANQKDGISTNPAQQLKDHFDVAFEYFNGAAGRSLADFNLVGNVGYSAGAAAMMYLWHKDGRNFNAAMSKYYTDWQEAEALSSGNGWYEAFYDSFWKNANEYYTLNEFVTEFDAWITTDGATKDGLWNVIAKTNAQIIHTNVEPTTPNTPTSGTKTIPVSAAAKVIDNGGVNKYFIDGVQQKTLVLKAGSNYKFSYGANHPLRFSITEDGTHGGGVAYESGVNVSAATNEVSITAPNSSSLKTLYYYCAAHPGMGGKITIVEQFTEISSSGGGSSGGGGSNAY